MKCHSCNEGRLKAESVTDYDNWDNMVEFKVYYKCDFCRDKFYAEVQQDWYQLVRVDPFVPKTS